MTLHFTKMHGLGNDFMVIDAVNHPVTLTPERIACLSDRHTGIGFDQCLVIEPSLKSGIDFNYRIFNANGQEVGQCGNGARCLALFAQKKGLITKNRLKIATKTTVMGLFIHQNHTVTVDMGKPRLAPIDIPLIADKTTPNYVLECNHDPITCHALSIGNPHAVLLVHDIESAPVNDLGRLISQHPRFPEGANVSFIQITHQNQMKLRVYERGCGETKACGSAAVAAVAVGRLFYHMDTQVIVSLPGGDLTIDWPNTEGPIYLTGPAFFVYEGAVPDDFL